eukprot:2169086-Rhodomonas_salina.5
MQNTAVAVQCAPETRGQAFDFAAHLFRKRGCVTILPSDPGSSRHYLSTGRRTSHYHTTRPLKPAVPLPYNTALLLYIAVLFFINGSIASENGRISSKNCSNAFVNRSNASKNRGEMRPRTLPMHVVTTFPWSHHTLSQYRTAHSKCIG